MKQIKSKGFTLVELIIVIAVIGILAAILIPVFSNVIDKANTNSALSDARNTVSQYIIDAAENSSLPQNVVVMVKKGGNFYLYGYNSASGGQLQVSDKNPYEVDTPQELVDNYSWNAKHNYDGSVPESGKEYDESAGSFFLVPYNDDGSQAIDTPLKGFHGTKASDEAYRLLKDEMSEDMGEDVLAYHGILIGGSYTVDNNGGSTIPETSTAPDPTQAPDPTMYTVKYDANGGSGTMASTEVADGTSTTLPACVFTPPTHKHFAGWKANNTGAAIEAGQSYTVTGNVTFYAQWENDTSYTVTYIGNGGSGTVTDTKTYYANDIVTLKANGFTNEGYEFTGWKVNNTGDLKQAGDTFKITDDTTVYAQWEKVPVAGGDYTINITYRNGFASGGPTIGTATYKCDCTLGSNTITRLELLNAGVWPVPSTGGYYSGILGIGKIEEVDFWTVDVTADTATTYELEIFVLAMYGSDPLL